MSRKREKPYNNSRHIPYTYPNPKRRRPPPPQRHPSPEDIPQDKPAPPPALLVLGLPSGCSVLDLKSRFEIYGSISRIRIDPQGVGSVCFRTRDAAESAVNASLDPSFGISIDSNLVRVIWATETNDINIDNIEEKGRRNANSSKLTRGETPLSRHGRGNRLSSAIVGPTTTSTNSSVLEPAFKPRELVAYDDIL